MSWSDVNAKDRIGQPNANTSPKFVLELGPDKFECIMVTDYDKDDRNKFILLRHYDKPLPSGVAVKLTLVDSKGGRKFVVPNVKTNYIPPGWKCHYSGACPMTSCDLVDWCSRKGTIKFYFTLTRSLGDGQSKVVSHGRQMDMIAGAFDSKVGADVKLVMGKLDLMVSKFVLMVNSKVFKAMFDGDVQTTEIKIADFDYITMLSVVQYMYGCKIDLQDIDNGLKVLAAADKYDLGGLKVACEQFIGLNLTDGTILKALALAEKLRAQNLIGACFEFLANLTVEVIEQLTGWSDLEGSNYMAAMSIRQRAKK